MKIPIANSLKEFFRLNQISLNLNYNYKPNIYFIILLFYY